MTTINKMNVAIKDEQFAEILNKISDVIISNVGEHTVYRAMTAGESFKLDDHYSISIQQAVNKRGYNGLYRINDGVYVVVWYDGNSKVASEFFHSATETISWVRQIIETETHVAEMVGGTEVFQEEQDDYIERGDIAREVADEWYDASLYIDGLDDAPLFEQVARVLGIKRDWDAWYSYVSNRLGCDVGFDDGFQPFWYGDLIETSLFSRYDGSSFDFDEVLSDLGLNDEFKEEIKAIAA